MAASLFPDLIVNGEVIPQAELDAETQNHVAPKGKPLIARQKAANALAVRTLLLQEVRRRGLQAIPREVAPGRFETEEEALIRDLLDQAIPATVLTDAQVQAEWARDPSRFRSPPLWEVSHILCACDPRDDAARTAAQAHAKALNEEALRDPRGFAALARRTSDCGSKSNGGALGQLGPGDTVPEFETALRELSEAEITQGPVLSRYGWHIIRMDAVAPGQILPFESVKDQIAAALERAAWDQTARVFVAGLVESAEISGAKL
ncbi:peptidylprolyl isomerase [Denitrobaculum tricleocarpae]|uniref:Parvulin-like PPIase n=1 Tax=Denitrobaculum tricleocarpae TaxID=2591009 RepID=A0A545TMW5_9PROT|nr:peptidylprolyl isomerase [Denitrobaculum tricleocarpae]TQV78577.1 peptidase [Denitrobaculum tricleocarpae]